MTGPLLLLYPQDEQGGYFHAIQLIKLQLLCADGDLLKSESSSFVSHMPEM